VDTNSQVLWAISAVVLIAVEIGLMMWEARHPEDNGQVVFANWRMGLSFGVGALVGAFLTVGLASRGGWAAVPVGLATLSTAALTVQYVRHAFNR
jgi:hypothetical protein